jgi:uncharacterized protein (TIGR02611 family)
MKGSLKALKKILIFIFGVFVVVLGVILLPLPGPGLLVIIAGLVILSTEFEWAQRYLHTAKKRMRDIYEKAKRKRRDHDK